MFRTSFVLNARILISIFALIGSTHGDAIAGAPTHPRMFIEIAGHVGSDCYPDQDVLLTGSQGQIVVRIVYDEDSTTSPWSPSGPLEGLTLTAGLRSLKPDEKAAAWQLEPDNYPESPALIDRLHPEFYITHFQALAISHLGKNTDNSLHKYPEYHYLITFPEDLAEQLLCVTGILDHPLYGHLEASNCARIGAPCSKDDVNRVLGTYVGFAFESQNFQRAITLADSLLATGWHSWLGLKYASFAAFEIGRFDRELEYFDLLYVNYGRVSWGPSNPAHAERDYKAMRATIIERIKQQQQDTLQLQSRE
ncbi:MAG: hypothetical protein ACOZB3_05535 [Calditrichota bacterium]